MEVLHSVETLMDMETLPYNAMAMQKPSSTMGRRRALLTDRERELIASDDEADEDQRYVAISRVRNKIENELPTDLELLAEHHPQLLSELEQEVCDHDN